MTDKILPKAPNRQKSRHSERSASVVEESSQFPAARQSVRGNIPRRASLAWDDGVFHAKSHKSRSGIPWYHCGFYPVGAAVSRLFLFRLFRISGRILSAHTMGIKNYQLRRSLIAAGACLR